MKHLFVQVTTTATITAAVSFSFITVKPAQAINLKSYTVKWSGAHFGNDVTITGTVVLDLDLVNNPGWTGGIPGEIGPGTPFHSLELEVMGALDPNANGLFTTADFDEAALYFKWPVDLEQDFVTQINFPGAFADFNVFRSNSNPFAPHGVDYYTVEVFGEEEARITNFAPTVPTPAVILPSLFGLGRAAFHKSKIDTPTTKRS